jgi:hypothetical protein
VQLDQCYSLIPCLFISSGLVVPVVSRFCLFSYSVCRIPWRNFCSGGLVVIYYFSFSLSWKILLLHLFWMTVLLGRVSEGLSYFHSVSGIPHSMPFLLLRLQLRNLLWFWWVYLCVLFVFSILQPSIFFLYSLCLLF